MLPLAAAIVAAMAGALLSASEPRSRHEIKALVTCAGMTFAVIGAICDWDWFMDDRRARPFVSLLGRVRTRVLYAVVGGAIAGGTGFEVAF